MDLIKKFKCNPPSSPGLVLTHTPTMVETRVSPRTRKRGVMNRLMRRGKMPHG